MTETLTRVLHERADAARLGSIDVDAITRAGALTVRRRHWTAVTGLVSALAVVGAIGALGLGGTDRHEHDAATSPTAVATITWASGTYLHTQWLGRDGWSGSSSVDVGHHVSAYVRTARGYVLTDGQQIWSYVDGHLSQVATVEGFFPSSTFRLVGDTDGTLVAWLSERGPVVLDLATGEVHEFPMRGVASVLAVDGRAVYVNDSRGVGAIDVDSGSVTPLESGSPPVAFEDGRVAVRSSNGNLFVPATGPGDRAPAGLEHSNGVASFSPDARWLAVTVATAEGGHRVKVFDPDGGAPVMLRTGSVSAEGYEWADDDTLAVLSLETPSSHYRLLACTVSEPSCAVVVPDLGEGRDDGGNGVRFVLPIGEPYFPYPHG